MTPKRIKQIAIVVIIFGAIIYLEVSKPRVPAGAVQDVVVTYATATSTNSVDSTTSTSTSMVPLAPASAEDTAARIAQEKQQYQMAKEIVGPTGFVNSPNSSSSASFTLSQFTGNKVVLLDFWTYSCINCERTLPYLNAWYQKYKDYGFEIVGVHTPEFQFEKVYSNVTAAVERYGVHYPVALDSDMGTWNAYNNQYWPAEYLINIDGYVVHHGIGEGNYAETEQAIQAALKERDRVLGLPDNVPTGLVDPANAVNVSAGGVQSPETYFGAERNEYLANGSRGVAGAQVLTAPTLSDIPANLLYLSGSWNFTGQYAENVGTSSQSTSKIFYTYNAKNMYFVAAANSAVAPNGVKINVILDGVSQGTQTIQANMLYDLIKGTAYGRHTVEIDVEGPGLEAYTFTFG